MRGVHWAIPSALALVTLGAAPASATLVTYAVDVERLVEVCLFDPLGGCELRDPLAVNAAFQPPARLTFTIDEAVLGRTLEDTVVTLSFGMEVYGGPSAGSVCVGRDPALSVHEDFVLGVATCPTAFGEGRFDFGAARAIESFSIVLLDGPPDALIEGVGDGIARAGAVTGVFYQLGGVIVDEPDRDATLRYEGTWSLVSVVPAPASAALLATSLGGLSFFSLWKRRRMR